MNHILMTATACVYLGIWMNECVCYIRMRVILWLFWSIWCLLACMLMFLTSIVFRQLLWLFYSQRPARWAIWLFSEPTIFIPPLSNCCMCMDPSLTGFYRMGQKLSDIIPVLRITPRATEPSTISVFLSIVKCSRACRAQTCAHSVIEPYTLAMGFLQGGPKTFNKFLSISRFYVPTSQQQLQLQAYDPSQ